MLDQDRKRLFGFIDGIEAMQQAIHKILQTERYAYRIYSWNYGSELERFIGKEFDYALAALEGEIRESLSVDDRIMNLRDFQITRQGIDGCLVSFTAETRVGNVQVEEVIQL